MNFRQALYAIWSGEVQTAVTINSSAYATAKEVKRLTGSTPTENTVNMYRWKYRNEPHPKEELNGEQREAGKKLRNSEQKRRWKIEEAVNMLIAEEASLHEMQAAGLQFVVLKTAA